MHRLIAATALVAAAAAAAAPWSGVCGDPTCSKQGQVVGPATLQPIWTVATPQIQVLGISIPSSAQINVNLLQSCGGGAAVCPSTLGLSAASGASIFNVSSAPSTPALGVPAVLAGPNGSVSISVQGWADGANVSALVASDSGSGAAAWMFGRSDGHWGDLAACTDPVACSTVGLAFAVFSRNSSLVAVNASNGAQAWSLPLATYTTSSTAAAMAQTVTLSADGTTAFVTVAPEADGGGFGLVAVDLVARSVKWNWTVWWTGTGPLSPQASKPILDQGTHQVLFVNGSFYVTVDSFTGQLTGVVPLPDTVDTSAPASVANDVSGQYQFVFATVQSYSPGVAGMPAVYAISKITGGAYRYTFGDTTAYWKLGGGIALDASGGTLYVPLLGPQLGTAGGAGGSRLPGGLQQTGSVYVAVVQFDGGSFSHQVFPAPAVLQQSGAQPLIAVGPQAGQIVLTAATNGGGVVLMGGADAMTAAVTAPVALHQ